LVIVIFLAGTKSVTFKLALPFLPLMFLPLPGFLLAVLFILGCVHAGAQTCTGSLGDPIVNITFGSGSNFGPPLPSGTTSSLQYMAATCPNDGFYSIVNYTSGCWSSDVFWHSAKDHTGNDNGYYMLVNASYQPSDFYTQKVDGLCEGTTYRFSAWLLNMCSVTGILPNITMTIERTDGSILATYNTGDIPIINPITWSQYGFYFTTPAGVSTVVLRMRNNAPGGVGNDVGLDDITFRPAGPAIATHITGFISDTVQLCSYNTQDLQFTSSVEACYSSTALQWQLSTDTGVTWSNIPGATTNLFTRKATTPGTYLYRLLAAPPANIGTSTCRVASTPLTVVVHAAVPPATITATICEGETYFGHTKSGTYTDVFKTAYGCDSVRTVVLTKASKARTTIDTAICERQSYAGYRASGLYIDTLKTVAGCDSVRTLRLTVHPTSAVTLDTTICYGGNVEGFTTSGTYRHVLKNRFGCDSTRTIHLTVIPQVEPNLALSTFFAPAIHCGFFRDHFLLTPGRTARLTAALR
jgi:hypothetical protein